MSRPCRAHQRKDLLHRVVKKVLVHDRRTLEVTQVKEEGDRFLHGGDHPLDLTVIPYQRASSSLRVITSPAALSRAKYKPDAMGAPDAVRPSKTSWPGPAGTSPA